MEIKTCEEYVLAELKAAQARADLYQKDHDNMIILKSLFTVEKDETTKEIKIGVRDELLDPTQNIAAFARINLLLELFGVTNDDLSSIDSGAECAETDGAHQLTLEEVFGDALMPVTPVDEKDADGESDGGGDEKDT